MTSTTFDTLTAARDLEAAGIERGHAEATATAIGRGDERLATKADLDRLEAATKADLAALRAELRADLYRALLIQGGAIVAILTALKLLS